MKKFEFEPDVTWLVWAFVIVLAVFGVNGLLNKRHEVLNAKSNSALVYTDEGGYEVVRFDYEGKTYLLYRGTIIEHKPAQ